MHPARLPRVLGISSLLGLSLLSSRNGAGAATGISYGDLSSASLSLEGLPANASSGIPSMSGDGRYIAFLSDATNLVTGDVNGKRDVFVRDRNTQQAILASTSAAGVQGNGTSVFPMISQDGRWVVFESDADNLVADDHNHLRDVFVKDLSTGATERISVSSAGVEADGASMFPAISADGRFVVFQSTAANLVADDTNGLADIFIRDRALGTTTRVSVGSGNVQADGASSNARVSADGRYIIFDSAAANLVAGDTNGVSDIFLRDAALGLTRRISIRPDGGQADGASTRPRMTPDASFAVFSTQATNFISLGADEPSTVVLVSLLTGDVERVTYATDGSAPNGASGLPDLSADARMIAYTSGASNLVDEDNNGREDVFVYDRTLQTTYRVSVSNLGTQIDGFSDAPTISADGMDVAFMSDATHLTPVDDNHAVDVFVFDFTNGGPPPAVPFETMDFGKLKGRVVNLAGVGRDSFAVSGTYTFNEKSVDGAINAPAEDVEIRFGDASGPVVLKIAANDPHWKATKKGRWTYRSPATASVRFLLIIDSKAHTFTLRAHRFDFPVAVTATLQLRMQIGNDLGIKTQAWTGNKKGNAFWLR